MSMMRCDEHGCDEKTLQSTPKDSQAASTTGPAGPLKSFDLNSEPLKVFVEKVMSDSSSNGAVI